MKYLCPYCKYKSLTKNICSSHTDYIISVCSICPYSSRQSTKAESTWFICFQDSVFTQSSTHYTITSPRLPQSIVKDSVLCQEEALQELIKAHLQEVPKSIPVKITKNKKAKDVSSILEMIRNKEY